MKILFQVVAWRFRLTCPQVNWVTLGKLNHRKTVSESRLQQARCLHPQGSEQKK